MPSIESMDIKLNVSVNAETGILEINGIRYSAKLFSVGFPEITPEGKYIRVIKNQDGVITFYQGQFKDHGLLNEPKAGG